MTQSGTLMRVVVRADASIQIGTGHVMRCLTLATGLADRGVQVDFICRAHDGNLIALIEQRGFRVITLPFAFGADKASLNQLAHAHWLGCDWQTDAQQSLGAIFGMVDWLIVDHYALDHRWETAMRPKCARIMCIDDLADRSHDCDLLLDQSLGRCSQDYAHLVPEPAKLLLGPKYALLRPEFAQWRDASLARRETPQLRHILVTMGGVDAGNVTGRVLTALQNCNIKTLNKITVVLGSHAPWRDQIIKQAADMLIPTRVVTNINNMAELMTSCDLAIGAGGSTTWERCALGLPAITVIIADNQQGLALKMQSLEASLVVTDTDALSENLTNIIIALDLGQLKDISDRCRNICDGTGVDLVTEYMES